MNHINNSFLSNGINIPSGETGNVKTTCPKCSDDRTKSSDPCLSVNVDEGVWNCHHCGWKGCLAKSAPTASDLATIAHEAPAPLILPDNRTLANEHREWLAKRDITDAVIEAASLYSLNDALKFPYIKFGAIVNIKTRAKDKRFSLEKGRPLPLYNYDGIDTECLIWVEGEIDALSVRVAGHGSVVSVPTGAKSKLDPLIDDRVLAVKQHIIAVDADEPGQDLQDSLIKKLGADKCLVVQWPEGIKDANDMLIERGADALLAVIENAQLVPAAAAAVDAAADDDDDDAAVDTDDAKQVIETAITKGAEDAGALFDPSVIKAAAKLDSADYARMRSKIKALKVVSLTQFDREVEGAKKQQGDTDDAPRLTDSLIDLVKKHATLFHDADNNAYATVNVNNHTENWALKSQGFKDWLSLRAYKELGACPSENTFNTVFPALNGHARYEGEQHEVYLRVAKREDRYYIDLCDDQWRCVEISAEGWRVLERSPTRFCRTQNMRALPIPEQEGDIALLWDFINIAEKQRPLLIAAMLECWRPDTPYPCVEFNGAQGSGKSDSQDRIRSLLDPNRVNLRSAPRSIQDLYVSAANNHVVSLNNVSTLKSDMQDALCILSTGGGDSARTLYTNYDEAVIEVKRPVFMNGIAALATRPDLIDRLVRLNLVEIPEHERREAHVMADEFNEKKASIFGALLDVFVESLRALPAIELAKKPRMASFAMLGEAVCTTPAFAAYKFSELYAETHREAVMSAIESSPFIEDLLEMLDKLGGWRGTVKELFHKVGRLRRRLEVAAIQRG